MIGNEDRSVGLSKSNFLKFEIDETTTIQQKNNNNLTPREYIMKKALIAAIAGFAISLSANAGDWGGKGVSGAIAPEGDVGATLSAGYMTNYIFYGVEFAEQSVWTGIDYSLDALPLPLDVGAWYLNGY